MAFDIKAARSEGYSDEEIASFLEQTAPTFNVRAAMSEGYSLDDISAEISSPQKPQSIAGKTLSVVKTGIEKPLGIPIANIAKSAYRNIVQPFGAEGGMSEMVKPGNVQETYYDLMPEQERMADTVTGAAFESIPNLPVNSTAKEALKLPLLSGIYPPKPSVIAMSNLPQLIKPQGSIAPKNITRYATSKITGIPEETMVAWEKNPQLLESKTLEAIAANRIPEISSKFENIRTGLAAKAKEALSTSQYLEEGAIPKTKILDSVKNVRKDLGGVYTSESKQAAKTLKNIEENFKKLRNTVSQNNLHELMQQLDNEIPWDKVWKSPETLTPTDNSLIALRTRFDSFLKDSNKEYKQIMKPLSEAIQTRNEFFKKFNVERVKEVGEKGTKTVFMPGDFTVSRLKNVAKESKFGTERVIQNIKKATGEDLSPEVQNALWRQEIEEATMKVPWTDIKFNSKDIAEKVVNLLRDKKQSKKPLKVIEPRNKPPTKTLTPDKIIDLLRVAQF